MARAKKKKTYAQAIRDARKESRAARAGAVGLRWSEARGAYYLPIKRRSPAGKRAASKYERTACSAGASAQKMAKGDIVGALLAQKGACGPKAMGSSRSHELLGYWRGVLHGKGGSLGAFKRNPGPNLAYVYMPNPRKGGKVQWGLIEPRTEAVLAHGVSATPEAGYKAAHKKAQAMVGGYKGRDVEMKAGKEWTQVPRRGKKNPKKKAKKNPDARAILRNAMRGT